MSNAKRDQNYAPTILGVLNTDGETLVPIKVNATNHSLKVENADTGSDNGPDNAPHDENYVPALMAVSSADGVTPVVVYANSDGELLIQST